MLKMKPTYPLTKEGYYKIDNFDVAPTFASFFSGIAGVDGIPLWTFYVNRGQCISSFGIRDKSKAIMEFYPANEAYKQVQTTGFRTFIKLNNEVIYEPFAVSTSEQSTRTMYIRNNDLIIEETNEMIQLHTKVTYFTIPNEDIPCFTRMVEVTNLADEKREIEIVDGLPALLPPGVDNTAYKAMSNTTRSWMQADVLSTGVGVYKIRSSMSDSSRVSDVHDRYFACSFNEEGIIPSIVDPELVFGHDAAYQQPVGFKVERIEALTDAKRSSFNKVPAAFAGFAQVVGPKEVVKISTVIGYCAHENEIPNIVQKVTQPNYLKQKQVETNDIIKEVTKHVDTKTAYPLFDEYVKQCYVDNALRGGYPLQLQDKNYYVYSRKHGDLERDYNFFTIEPSYYSQGNGNFRDLNQNRRLDTYLHPFVGDENIRLFYSLMQLDGYNPLVIKGKQFIVRDEQYVTYILNSFAEGEKEEIAQFITNFFSVGELLQLLKGMFTQEETIMEHFEVILKLAEEENDAEYGEGFWVDHWTYNLDLVETYVEVYPERVKALLYGDKGYRFFNSPEYVVPRSEKYVVENEKVRQYEALRLKATDGKWVKIEDGNVYTTTLMSKLTMLATVKFMTLDPHGIGIEMEANKPGWNDAMNGLPGLLGSSTAEVFELHRMLTFMLAHIEDTDSVTLPVEFADMLPTLQQLITTVLAGNMDDFNYWDAVATLRENYRMRTIDTLTGQEQVIEGSTLRHLLKDMQQKIDAGIKRMKEECNATIPTFLYYDVESYDVVKETAEGTFIMPRSFTRRELPAFLEGPARYLKLDVPAMEKQDIYDFVRQSGIYDEKLKMYKTSASLEEETFEIGRARGFTAGWLERESVFMHMEFKYLLALIKNGLYKEYFEDIQTALPPFMNPDVYGRSVLENSSFIASSANPDERVHGRGYVARLSGTTIEMLHMWKTMMVGQELFTYEDNQLTLTLSPILTSDFFNEEDEVQFTLLGHTKVVYYNPNRRHTFGENKGIITSIEVEGEGMTSTIIGNTISGTLAEQLRNGEVKSLYVTIQ